MRTRRWICASAALVVLLASLMVARPASSAPDRTVKTTFVAPGVVHKKIVAPAWPNRINVLEIDPSTSATVDVALATGALNGRAVTSDIAKRHRAVAAINGSFVEAWGRPSGLFAEDGRLMTSALYREVLFAPSADESSFRIGRFPLKIRASNPSVSALPLTVSTWNEEKLGVGQIGGYTPAGAGHLAVPRDTCSVRLSAPSNATWGPGGNGVVRVHDVVARRCAWKPLRAVRTTVLAARRGSAAARSLKLFSIGDQVRITWSVGLPHLFDAVGGSPRLIADGAVVATRCNEYVCQRHPRTGVGVTASGKVLFVTVDGRQSGYSIGMDTVDFAHEFKRLGAVEAINLDGGGSTTMVVRGQVVNRPSGGSQRRVGHALLVLNGRDQAEPYMPWSQTP